jgi:hypothetical protein
MSQSPCICCNYKDHDAYSHNPERYKDALLPQPGLVSHVDEYVAGVQSIDWWCWSESVNKQCSRVQNDRCQKTGDSSGNGEQSI